MRNSTNILQKKLLLSLISLLLISSTVFSMGGGSCIGLTTGNIVTNFSFESWTDCPSAWNVYPPNGNTVNTWRSANDATPDFYTPCIIPCGWCPHPFQGYWNTPGNFLGSQAPITGNSYSGIIAYEEDGLGPSEWKEYIQIQTTCALEAGVTYEVSFYASLCDDCDYSVIELGAYISSTAISKNDAFAMNSYTPQIVNTGGQLTNKSGWTKISGNYTAAGGEQYMTIGNFNNNAGTTVGNIGGPNPQTMAYYYIEDACITGVGGDCLAVLPVSLTSFKATVHNKEDVELTWVTSSERNSDYFVIERSTDGASFENIGTIDAAGNSSTTLTYSFNDNSPYSGVSYYRIKQVDYNGGYEYSGVIDVDVLTSIKVKSVKANQFTKSIEMTIVSPDDQVVMLDIFDLLGRTVHTENIDVQQGDNRHEVDLSDVTGGIHIMKITTSHKIYEWKQMTW